MSKPRICIGIPCYRDVAAETLEDYMRFAFHCGRRMEGYDFFLAIKSKSEQFRARNAIVEVAIRCDAKYLLMLDDDHVIDWRDSQPMTPEEAAGSGYGFLGQIIEHMERSEKLAICGALYYQRGGDCLPVLMKEGKDGGYYWLREDEVKNELQPVAVTGGGCMVIDMNLFSVIPSPWFEPELEHGTDIQICQKARNAGFEVACDTSLTLGHVKSSREVVTQANRARVAAETHASTGGSEGISASWQVSTAHNEYMDDVYEYTGKGRFEILKLADEYNSRHIPRFGEYADHRDYYRSLDECQIARQAIFHGSAPMLEQIGVIFSMIDTNRPGRGADVGCGSAPVGFELARRGHLIDFIDLDGSPAYEFLKWRAKRHSIDCGWAMPGNVEQIYDYVLMLDSIEHIADWESVIDDVVPRLKEGGAIITNFFLNRDFDNPEHVMMDHAAVQKHLVGSGLYPVNQMTFIRKDLGFMDAKSAA